MCVRVRVGARARVKERARTRVRRVDGRGVRDVQAGGGGDDRKTLASIRVLNPCGSGSARLAQVLVVVLVIVWRW